MFGGIIGGIVSSVISSAVSSIASSLMSQVGSSNFFGALGNLILDSIGDVLKNAINSAPLPQFLKDAANTLIDGVLEQNKMETTPEAKEGVKDIYEGMMDSAKKEASEEIDKKTSGKSGANWLVALAGGLAEVQGKFLMAAMENQEKMESLGTGKEDSQEFLTQQNEYQANMQMFNMMANASSTSIKSIGEGLTALARKQ